MSNVLSTTYQNRWLDALLGSSRAAAMPATVKVHLYTTDPDGGGVELTGGGYVAATVANTDANFPPATAGEKASTDFFFTLTGAASAPATWGVISDGTTLIIGGPLGSVVNASGAGTASVSLSINFPAAP